MRKVHLNTIIKVKLTDYGRDIYYHQFDDMNEAMGKKVIEPSMPETDEKGRTSFELWYFMKLYGKHLSMSGEKVIDPLYIWYDKDKNI